MGSGSASATRRWDGTDEMFPSLGGHLSTAVSGRVIDTGRT